MLGNFAMLRSFVLLAQLASPALPAWHSNLALLSSYLKLNMCLSNILRRSVTTNNLLCLGDLGLDSLAREVVKRVTLNSIDRQNGAWVDDGEAAGEEELLGGSGLLNDLDESWLELLDGWNVVGEDTHLSGVGGDVDLNDVLGGVDLLLVRCVLALGSLCPIDPFLFMFMTSAFPGLRLARCSLISPPHIHPVPSSSLSPNSCSPRFFQRTSCGRDKLNLICAYMLAIGLPADFRTHQPTLSGSASA